MDHKWRKDRDGAESCEREGCTVRKHVIGWNRDVTEWQRTRRGHWRQTMPIPPCAGKEAADMKTCAQCQGPHAMEACTLGADVHLRPKPSPSPLEVVRGRTESIIFSLEDEYPQVVARLRSALATLEESIRKDEREKCAAIADHEATESENMWRAVKDERKAYGWRCRASGAELISKRIRE